MEKRDGSNSINRRDLSKWLLFYGYAEEERGYGHVSADDLAEALLEHFDVRMKSELAEALLEHFDVRMKSE